jgi:hypothetical protein
MKKSVAVAGAAAAGALIMRAWDYTHQVIEAEDWTAAHYRTWRNGEWYKLTEHPNASEDGSSTFGVPTRWWIFRDVLGIGGKSIYDMSGFGPRPPWWRVRRRI